MFLGTPTMAVPPLLALLDAGFDVPMVVSRADKRRGRRSEPSPSPVKAAALERGVPVTARVDDVLDVDADVGVVVAFGRIIKPHVLAELPMVNLHFSLLPRWRGAAPVERALLAGDTETGVDLMVVAEGLDTGGIYARRVVPIRPDHRLDTLRADLVAVGTELLVDQLSAGLAPPEPQEGDVTYADKIDRAELELRFDRPAVELDRVIRLGGAWTTFRDRRLLVHEVEVLADGPPPGQLDGAVVGTTDGGLRLVEVQPEGKRRQPADAWLNGARPTPDDRLGP